jgi:hypothetical protein
MNSTLTPGSSPVETSGPDKALPSLEDFFETGLLMALSPRSQVHAAKLPHWHQAPFGPIWPASATIANGAGFTVALFGARENHIGRVKMQIAANNNLTFIRLFSFDINREDCISALLWPS